MGIEIQSEQLSKPGGLDSVAPSMNHSPKFQITTGTSPNVAWTIASNP